MAQAWSNWLAGAWENFRVEPEEIRELDDERVLVLVHISAKGRSSGLELDQMRARGVAIFHVRDGTVIRFVAYWAKPFQAGGLSVTCLRKAAFHGYVLTVDRVNPASYPSGRRE
jgi:hypothetical protein